MSRCENSLFGAHDFRPRYDQKPVVLKSDANSLYGEVFGRQVYTRKLYVRDVCERCGATIERSPQ